MLTAQISGEDMRGRVGFPGLGIIDWKSDSDRHDNQVSIITLPDNTKFRMVHHVSKGSYEYATVYAGRNKFMRYKYHVPERDAQATTLSLGNFSTSWGDGDNLGADVDPKLPEQIGNPLKQILSGIREGGLGIEQSLFILNVLLHTGNLEYVWQSKGE